MLPNKKTRQPLFWNASRTFNHSFCRDNQANWWMDNTTMQHHVEKSTRI